MCKSLISTIQGKPAVALNFGDTQYMSKNIFDMAEDFGVKDEVFIFTSGGRPVAGLYNHIKNNSISGDQFVVGLYKYSSTDGHVIHAYNDNGIIKFGDPQSGEVYSLSKLENKYNYFSTFKVPKK
jgi:hypothetical protein